MDNETSRMREQITQLLSPAKNKGFYCCPLCGSGQGQHQTGALHLCPDKIHVKCFSCSFYGDIFDLVAAQFSLDGVAVFEKTRLLLGQSTPPFPSRRVEKALTPPPDSRAYLARCAAALWAHPEALRYLQARGFSEASLRAFSFGYDETAQQIVIPYGDGYFIRRSIGESKRYFKPPTAEYGPEPLFGGETLAQPGCVFVVESQLCALSIRQAGGRAVALGGTGTGTLLAALAGAGEGLVLALALDNDERGRQTAEKLAAELRQRGQAFVLANPAGGYKDPNEALQREGKRFALRVLQEGDAALAHLSLAAASARQEYQLAHSAAGQTEGFLQALAQAASQPRRSTGFSRFDVALGGGLFPGLYILGALSSLGKTTFALQLADQMAATGQEVLFFSLEMSRHELMAKSLSRLACQNDGSENANTPTARELLSGQRTGDDPALRAALAAYAAFSPQLYFVEGGPDMTVGAVWAAVQRHREQRGCTPVVVLDYLQILAPLDMRATDKQNTDRAVFELKRLSRELDTPVLAISSLNRENYTARLSMSAFKESGAIEYSSDVLLGLQFRLPPGADKLSPEMLEGMKQADPRELELKILKNRNGPAGASLPFDYCPRGNLFAEAGAGEGAKRR